MQGGAGQGRVEEEEEEEGDETNLPRREEWNGMLWLQQTATGPAKGAGAIQFNLLLRLIKPPPLLHLCCGYVL
jgi:hypothetical protein